MRAGDGHGLALAARHGPHRVRRPGFGFQLGEQLARALMHRAVVEQLEGPEAAHFLTAQEDIGRGSEVVAERQILIDDLDAGGARIHRQVKMHRLTFQRHHAGRGREIAGHDLDQGRFAGAVVAHQSHDLARLEMKIDAGQRLDRTEMLGYGLQFEQRHRSRSSLASVRPFMAVPVRFRPAEPAPAPSRNSRPPAGQNL